MKADLPPLREVVARHGLGAIHGLGQHFLFDGNITRRIAAVGGDLAGIHVLEIGPGPGGLTRALLETRAAQVVAVERDRRCIAALLELQGVFGDRLKVVEADALAFDLARVARPTAVISNLPYNIGTPLLIDWLKSIKELHSLTLMFQDEVARRIVAPPGSSVYGRLSVMVQWRTRARLVFTLPARAFVPPPKVASAVVHLEPLLEGTGQPAWVTMERVTRVAFSQRRKMLRQCLRSLGNAEALLAAAGLAGTCRAEEISVADFVAIASAYEANVHLAPA